MSRARPPVLPSGLGVATDIDRADRDPVTLAERVQAALQAKADALLAPRPVTPPRSIVFVPPRADGVARRKRQEGDPQPGSALGAVVGMAEAMTIAATVGSDYTLALSDLTPEEIALDALEEHLDAMAPRSMAERYLAAQAFVGHLRTLRLVREEAREPDARKRRALAGAVAESMNTQRRTVEAFDNLRRPRAPSFRAGQVNMADQQVVVQGQTPERKGEPDGEAR